VDGNTSIDMRCVEEIDQRKYRILVTIPDDGELGAALMKIQRQLQACERRSAHAEQRQVRTITIQDVILRHCCEMEGVAFRE